MIHDSKWAWNYDTFHAICYLDMLGYQISIDCAINLRIVSKQGIYNTLLNGRQGNLHYPVF